MKGFAKSFRDLTRSYLVLDNEEATDENASAEDEEFLDEGKSLVEGDNQLIVLGSEKLWQVVPLKIFRCSVI